MDFKSITIDDAQMVYEGLSEALVHDGPVTVNIKTNPHGLAMPPKIEWEQLKALPYQ